MDGSLGSFRCPGCRISLVEAVFERGGFFFGSGCPYCGMLIHWSRPSLGLILLGIVSIGTGAFLLTGQAGTRVPSSMIIAVFIGLGLAVCLLGLTITRFEQTRPKNDPGVSTPRMDFPYM